MPLTDGKAALKLALQALAANTDSNKETTIDEFIDALENFIKSGTVIVPSAGLVAPNGPVTGAAQGTIT